MSQTQGSARTHCVTHGGARGIHENGSGGCEWVPVPELTEQEWQIIEAIRYRDSGRQDGDLAHCFALWARGELRILFDPLNRREVERLVAMENRRRGGGPGHPLRATL